MLVIRQLCYISIVSLMSWKSSPDSLWDPTIFDDDHYGSGLGSALRIIVENNLKTISRIKLVCKYG